LSSELSTPPKPMAVECCASLGGGAVQVSNAASVMVAMSAGGRDTRRWVEEGV